MEIQNFDLPVYTQMVGACCKINSHFNYDNYLKIIMILLTIYLNFILIQEFIWIYSKWKHLGQVLDYMAWEEDRRKKKINSEMEVDFCTRKTENLSTILKLFIVRLACLSLKQSVIRQINGHDIYKKIPPFF